LTVFYIICVYIVASSLLFSILYVFILLCVYIVASSWLFSLLYVFILLRVYIVASSWLVSLLYVFILLRVYIVASSWLVSLLYVFILLHQVDCFLYYMCLYCYVFILLHQVHCFLYYTCLYYYSTVTKRPYDKWITDFSQIPYFLHHTYKVAFSKTQPLYCTRHRVLAETLMRMSVLWDMTPCWLALLYARRRKSPQAGLTILLPNEWFSFRKWKVL
jgi:hypothetical protein